MARTVAIEIDIKGQKDVLKLTEAIKQTNKQLKQTQKEINEATTVTERLGKQKAYDKQVEQLVRLKTELKGARQEQRNAIRDFEAAKTGSDSYRALNAELVKTRQAFKELSKAEREGAKGRALITNIGRLDTELKKIDKSIGQFQRNVGNYRGALTGLGKTISRVFVGRSIVDGLRRISGFLGDVIERNKDTDKSISELSGAFNKIKGVAENLALSFLRTFGPAITSVINGVSFLAESLFGLSSVSNDATDSFFQQLDKVQKLEQAVLPLADRYDELTAKTKLSTAEQKELEEITGKLEEQVPNTAKVFNEYGEVIGVNTGKVRDFVQQQRDLLKVQNQSAIQEQTKNLKEYRDELAGATKAVFTGYIDVLGRQIELSDEQRQNFENRRAELQSLVLGTEDYLEILTGLNLETSNYSSALEDEAKATTNSSNNTKRLVTEYEKLQKNVQDATKVIQEQLAKGLTPTAQQIETLTNDTKQLNAVNDELKAILDELTPKKVEDSKATEDQTETTKDLTGAISDLNEQERELNAQTGVAGARLKALEDARAALANITGSEEDAAAQVLAIKENLANELSRIDTQTLQQQDLFIQSQIDNLEFQQQQELSNFEGTAQEKALLEQQLNTELATLRLEQVTTQEALLKKDVQNFKLAEDEKTEKAKQENEQRKKIVGQLVAGVQTILAAFDQLQAAQSQAEIDRLTQQQEARAGNLEDLQTQLENATGLERQFLEQQVAQEVGAAQEIENKKAAIQKAENERKKQSSIINAIINGAVAITQAFAQLGPIGGAISAVVIAATTALQIATISAQKFARGGMVNGPSHAQGGVKFAVGGRVNELEGGEAVINKRSTAMFKPLLSAVNVAGGGVRFANGGITQSLGAPSIGATTQIGTAVDSAQLLVAIQNRTSALEGAIINQKVTLNTRDTEQDQEDKKVILNTIS